jgi:hypothetical protein
LLAGVLLILLVNAVALTGVYLNRSGEPESRLRLSERELAVPWDWRGSKENSGLALGLNWRVGNEADAAASYYGGGSLQRRHAGMAGRAAHAALGFDTAPVAETQGHARRFERQQRREVLLVLELAGPAWQRRWKGRGRTPRGTRRRRWPMPTTRSSPTRPARAGATEGRGESNSRLFAIDAGLDLAALRAKVSGSQPLPDPQGPRAPAPWSAASARRSSPAMSASCRCRR